jgi:hypothetical protein
MNTFSFFEITNPAHGTPSYLGIVTGFDAVVQHSIRDHLSVSGRHRRYSASGAAADHHRISIAAAAVGTVDGRRRRYTATRSRRADRRRPGGRQHGRTAAALDVFLPVVESPTNDTEQNDADEQKNGDDRAADDNADETLVKSPSAGRCRRRHAATRPVVVFGVVPFFAVAAVRSTS